MATNIGKRLIADVFDLTFIQDGQVAIVAEDLVSASLDVKVNEKKITGGKGNPTLATLHSSREISISAENPVFDYGVLATTLGSEVILGSHVGYTMRIKGKVRVSGETKFLMLGREPLAGEVLKVYHKGELLTLTTDYTISGKVITFVAVDILQDDAVQVDPYKFTTSATAKKISINSDTYAKAGIIVLTTYEIDMETNRESQIQFVFPNAIMTGNFTIDTKSEIDANNQKLEFTINKPDNSTEIGYISEAEYIADTDLTTPLV